ncbi:hypothetical protein NX059_001319 [Plenodomus lindquistii]|nr:hypothetical protein NX059_001319 [Plenodomus lindquistii]
MSLRDVLFAIFEPLNNLAWSGYMPAEPYDDVLEGLVDSASNKDEAGYRGTLDELQTFPEMFPHHGQQLELNVNLPGRFPFEDDWTGERRTMLASAGPFARIDNGDIFFWDQPRDPDRDSSLCVLQILQYELNRLWLEPAGSSMDQFCANKHRNNCTLYAHPAKGSRESIREHLWLSLQFYVRQLKDKLSVDENDRVRMRLSTFSSFFLNPSRVWNSAIAAINNILSNKQPQSLCQILGLVLLADRMRYIPELEEHYADSRDEFSTDLSRFLQMVDPDDVPLFRVVIFRIYGFVLSDESPYEFTENLPHFRNLFERIVTKLPTPFQADPEPRRTAREPTPHAEMQIVSVPTKGDMEDLPSRRL